MFAKLLTGTTLEDLEKKLTDYLSASEQLSKNATMYEPKPLKIHHVHSFITQEVSGTPSISGPKVITKFSLMIIASYG